MYLSVQQVIDICNASVNRELLTAQNCTLCVDGTSCTKKTSILASTGRLVNKVSKMHNFRNPDSFFPSQLGYISLGVKSLRYNGPHFNDRSPLNVMDWSLLWMLINDFLTKYGNVRPCAQNVDHEQTLAEYRSILNNYKNAYFYKYFAKDVNCIVFIDSNVERCDELHAWRNESSDMDRMNWKFYTSLQNLMYKELYPGLCIDMADFGNADTDVVVQGVSSYLNMTLNYLSSKYTNSTENCEPSCSMLPTRKIDYHLMNMETHAYRSNGRWGVKLIAESDDCKLSSYIPDYITMKNISHPDGHAVADIEAKSIDHLLAIDSGDIDHMSIDFENKCLDNDEDVPDDYKYSGMFDSD